MSKAVIRLRNETDLRFMQALRVPPSVFRFSHSQLICLASVEPKRNNGGDYWPDSN